MISSFWGDIYQEFLYRENDHILADDYGDVILDIDVQGFNQIKDIRVGKLIEIEFKSKSKNVKSIFDEYGN